MQVSTVAPKRNSEAGRETVKEAKVSDTTNMLSWGFATEGVCVRGGPHVAKADNE